MHTIPFPQDFLWGCATASYQVEGATTEDGRSDSIWDTFSKVPGATYQGDDGKTACDQYHRYKEDIALMAKLGFSSYRFSIAWPRIIPTGTGEVNEKGIAYYRALCEELHRHGMSACATLYHWDLPECLSQKGGWTNRQSAYDFASYAKVCFELLGDVVDRWITINEPFCITYLGYLAGVHAPGHKSMDETVKAIHYINLAHALAVKEYRALGLTAPIGITLNPQASRPATRRKEDIRACLKAIAYGTEVFLGPLMGKGYPELGLSFPIEKGDMELIAKPIDFLGVNYYQESVIADDEAAPRGYSHVPCWEETTDMGWAINSDGLIRLLVYLDEYTNHLPLYITENGMANDDHLINGRVHDKARIDYLRLHLEAASEAINAGINLKGYFIWSFMDNYEWAKGYSKRFGIVYCDYETLARYPKDSAYYLRDVIAGF